MNKTIIVTGIGGNVGQGILRNIRKCNYDITIIGTNVKQVSAGNHLCDNIYTLPYAYEKDYIPIIKTVCKKHKVDLIIPSTDFESYYLALSRQNLPAVATSTAKTLEIFLDKYLSYKHLSKHNIPFAKAFLPSEYDDQFTDIIAKPRKGRGSRGIMINPSDISHLTDDYMIQELHRGIEITSAFYVTKQRNILGPITFERTLGNGATVSCVVKQHYTPKIRPIIEAMVEYFDIQGACNIQSIVNNGGDIHPFEINARISGTNSIRANFGFEDVKYTVDEYLYNQSPKQQPVIKQGAGLRILMDIIYPDIEDISQIGNTSQSHYLY